MASPFLLNACYQDRCTDTPLHTHSSYQILFLVDGLLQLSVGGNVICARAPALIFISALQEHAITVESSSYRRYYINLLPHEAEKVISNRTLSSLLTPRSLFRVLPLPPETAAAVEALFTQLVAQDPAAPFFREAQGALLTQLLILIYRCDPSLFSHETDARISTVLRIQKEIEDAFAQPLTLSYLAEKYHLSLYYLSHLFKRVTGYSVMQYLTAYRLSAARQMLAESDLPVTEIAYRTGFSDASSFSRLFRREVGCTPRAYRHSHGHRGNDSAAE